MAQQEYDALLRRLVAVSERQETTLAGITITLGKMDDRQADRQRLLVSLGFPEQTSRKRRSVRQRAQLGKKRGSWST